MRERIKKEKGITLIALVVTIIVLLILAGVTISTLTGDNGIITKTTESKEKTTQAKAEEMVSVAIGGLQTVNLGDTSKITPESIANQVMKDNNIENVIAEESTFPTYIVFQDDGVKVWVEIDLSIGNNGSYDGIYSEEGLEEKIAPEDLFDYEIIDDGTVAATEIDNLSEKTARITRIKPEYCNGYGYNPDTQKNDLEDTNYGINYDNDIIMNEKLLVIPYQVDGKYIPNGIEGELYTIEEVNINVAGDYSGVSSFPDIETIIYPNTVKKIISDCTSTWEGGGAGGEYTNRKIVLSNRITEIPYLFFANTPNLKNITIPDGVTKIDELAFQNSGIENITIPQSVTEIVGNVFESCKSLVNINVEENNSSYTSIEGILFDKEVKQLISYPIGKGKTEYIMPDTVTIIGDYAFYREPTLEKITLSKNIITIGNEAFMRNSSLSEIDMPDNIERIGAYSMGYCSSLKEITIPANIKYIGSSAFSYGAIEKVTYQGVEYTSDSQLAQKLRDNGVQLAAFAIDF